MSELSILQNALGLDKYGRGSKYRNRFIAGQGHSDLETIEKLVSKGLMKEDEWYRDKNIIGGQGSRFFYVTDKGEDYIVQNRSEPPKVSKPRKTLKCNSCGYDREIMILSPKLAIQSKENSIKFDLKTLCLSCLIREARCNQPFPPDPDFMREVQ